MLKWEGNLFSYLTESPEESKAAQCNRQGPRFSLSPLHPSQQAAWLLWSQDDCQRSRHLIQTHTRQKKDSLAWNFLHTNSNSQLSPNYVPGAL